MPDPTLESAGDELQSAASRLAEFVLNLAAESDEPVVGGAGPVPYEVYMAALEARAAAADWTEVRRKAKVESDD